jgi:enoyl-CoA hydratase/carnithine racemase
MAADEVLYEVDGHVATIRLNRPERRNAATFDMADQLREALARADADATVRAVVLTGSGDAFCAGDDVEAAWGDPRMAATMEELGGVRPPTTPEAVALLDMATPTIAAVNGPAMGSGMDFALWCDLRLAGEGARFAQSYVKMGLMCDVGGLWRLPQLVGLERATELLLTGRTVDAAEAERIGLVSRVLPTEELLPAAHELAGRIAANAPLAVGYIKEGLRRAAGRSRGELDDLGAFVGTGLSRLFATADHREAATAFVERRTPVFTGK